MNRKSSRKSVSESPSDNLNSARNRQSKKDEAIRKKAESDINKRGKTPTTPTGNKAKRVSGTVSSLKPQPALTVSSNLSILEASQLMAAKRSDCVLVINDNDQLSGIFTSKDLAFRVVAEGLDARTCSVAQIMTPSPMVVTADASATQALSTMVERGFRHLPVCNEYGDVYGLLDITKCLYDALEKMDRAYESSKKLYEAIQDVGHEWGGNANATNGMEKVLGDLKMNMSCPTLQTLLTNELPPCISPKTSVKDASKVMKERRVTAVLIIENEKIAGIFTSKDVVLRVIAAGLNPQNCSVVRVMTPHPDCAKPDTTILDALKKMHRKK